ncbi:MAG: glutaminyl-peptide cyclotransferase [Anaerolineales bacterium]
MINLQGSQLDPPHSGLRGIRRTPIGPQFSRTIILALLGSLTIIACAPQQFPTPAPTATPISPSRYTFRIVSSYPHDPGAYTQGLVYEEGFLYESTGLRGESTLRRVDLISGEVAQSLSLDPELFGEGIALLDDRIIQLTLTSGIGFVYDQQSFSKLDEFNYTPEGWGLTHDGQQLIMSDGSAELRFLDPESFQETSRVTVTDGDQPVQWLNELEYVEGEIYANVWQSDLIARISPDTGEVLGWINLARLRGDEPRAGILNGIAYDSERQRLFVTGKNWPELFEIELVRE